MKSASHILVTLLLANVYTRMVSFTSQIQKAEKVPVASASETTFINDIIGKYKTKSSQM